MAKREVYKKLEVRVLIILNILLYIVLQYIVFGAFIFAQMGGGPFLSDYLWLFSPVIFLIPLFIIRLQRKGFLKIGLFMITFLFLDLFLSLKAIEWYPSSIVVYSIPIIFFFMHSYIFIRSFSEKRFRYISGFVLAIGFIIFCLLFYNKGDRLEKYSQECFLNDDRRDFERCVFELGYSYIDSGEAYNNAMEICKNAGDNLISVWDELQGKEFIVSKRDLCYHEMANYVAFLSEQRRNIDTRDITHICQSIRDLLFRGDCLDDHRSK